MTMQQTTTTHDRMKWALRARVRENLRELAVAVADGVPLDRHWVDLWIGAQAALVRCEPFRPWTTSLTLTDYLCSRGLSPEQARTHRRVFGEFAVAAYRRLRGQPPRKRLAINDRQWRAVNCYWQHDRSVLDLAMRWYERSVLTPAGDGRALN